MAYVFKVVNQRGQTAIGNHDKYFLQIKNTNCLKADNLPYINYITPFYILNADCKCFLKI